MCLKNEPTLASGDFDKHGMILIFFGKQHEHTFRNYTHILLSLSLHFYLIHLLRRKWRDTGDLKQRLIEHGEAAYLKMSLPKLLINGKSGSEKAEKACVKVKEQTLWTSAKIKTAFFQSHHSLPRKTRYVSRHFRRSYLKADEVGRCEETRKAEYADKFW